MTGATAQRLRPAWPPAPALRAPDIATEALATGVAVLTCGAEADVQGVTVSTLALASVQPPVVSIALRRDSRALRTLLGAGTFVVNALGSRQEPLARHFASRRRPAGLGQLAPEAWSGRTEEGVPVLDGAVAWLACHIQRTVPVGDHELVLARVDRAVRGSGTPLLTFAGGLHPLPATPPLERQ